MDTTLNPVSAARRTEERTPIVIEAPSIHAGAGAALRARYTALDLPSDMRRLLARLL